MAEGGETKKKAKPRTPVVTVHCPTCGGSVDEAELGERTDCQYCGTRLHLPTVDFDEAKSSSGPATEERSVLRDEPAPPPRQPSLASGLSRGSLWVLCGSAFGLLVFVVYAASGDSGPERSPTPTQHLPTYGDDTQGILDNAKCTTDCTKPCMEIHDTDAMLKCLDGCTDKCKFVGKGTATECRKRCDGTCASAPDPASRAACASGCYQGCPR